VQHPAIGMGTHGFQAITFLLEKGYKGMLFLWITFAYAIACTVWCGGYIAMLKGLLVVPLIPFVLLLILIIGSWNHDGGKVDWTPYLDIKDASMASKYAGIKIPYTTVIEAYMHDKLDFKQDFYDTFLRRTELFRAAITFHDAEHYFLTFLAQNFGHTVARDNNEVATVYDRGNDFYNWCLGEPMKYSCGIYRDESDSLDDAQYRMLDLVCQQLGVGTPVLDAKKGSTYLETTGIEVPVKDMTHFDFGCGWGTLVCHSASRFNCKSYGITLSEEQAKWGRARADRMQISDRVKIMVRDYRDVESDTTLPAKYDVITCLEMAEHVGITHFQSFLLQVRRMLKPDGVFYLQIAGLRRAWQYEDLVWGLFMNKYIFPAADASCPLGFVTSQLERAGWEVHRVENTGVHYSLTIKHWYDNWIKNKDKVIATYDLYNYRQFEVFLGWSTIIAAQGSSTVFMTTNTLNHAVDGKTMAKESDAPINRMAKWVGSKPIGLQQ
jgi:cyclopropane fatty-acyl-phospholipid synthase-like methyltransferase